MNIVLSNIDYRDFLIISPYEYPLECPSDSLLYIPHHSLFEVRMLYILIMSPVNYGYTIAMFFRQIMTKS